MDISDFQQRSFDFFFDTIRWVFDDFLLRIKILNVPVLWYFIAIIIISIVLTGLVNFNRSSVGRSVNSVKRYRGKK